MLRTPKPKRVELDGIIKDYICKIWQKMDELIREGRLTRAAAVDASKL